MLKTILTSEIAGESHTAGPTGVLALLYASMEQSSSTFPTFSRENPDRVFRISDGNTMMSCSLSWHRLLRTVEVVDNWSIPHMQGAIDEPL
jgi:hypothetical protein